ncbi:probable endonuclease 4 isoform X2 [Electrophorus electricus]|uniref:probable endonuclease 4 isoform X2 n=1 Tax=Electrophorus electricus TaxID=8005 RepID=UPI000F0A0415|nr:probable endonuclease 4 isoform X2 [Electrophorus electricus]
MGPRKRGGKKRTVDLPEVEHSSGAGEPSEESSAEVVKGKRCKTKGGKKYIGAHVSIAGGIWKAVEASVDIGGRSFGLFLGSQRSWKRPALDKDAAVRFQEACVQHGFDPTHILPHGSYLMNCGSPKEGASMGSSTEQCMDRIAQAINHAHQQIPTVITVLENMSGQGSTVGGQFIELKGIIDRVRDKTRVGVCLDTCHAFAAGYDISSAGGVKSMLEEFDLVVGLHYLRAVHLNDSKGKLGCHLDRHEDIGRGQIGISAFRDIMNEPRLDNIPLILETPGCAGFEYAEQIQLLYSLCED